MAKPVTKTCSQCKQILPLEDFYKKTRQGGDLHGSFCKKCQSEWHKEYYRANQTKIKACTRANLLKHGYPYAWARHTIRQHGAKGIRVLFSPDELEERALRTQHCELCGCQLSWRFGKRVARLDSPTMDNAYLKDVLQLDDIMIVCASCNSMKQQTTLPAFVDYCGEMVVRYSRQLAQCRAVVKKFRNKEI